MTARREVADAIEIILGYIAGYPMCELELNQVYGRWGSCSEFPMQEARRANEYLVVSAEDWNENHGRFHF